YAEAVCNTSQVFFCEDFEGDDILIIGDAGDPRRYWRNPAIESADLYWSFGGTHQRSTIPLSGFDSSTNHGWRISKTVAFTDIVTGETPRTGAGALQGWLRPDIVSNGAREWYTRVQVYFSEDHLWPASLDYKVFFALPRQFVDPP